MSDLHFVQNKALCLHRRNNQKTDIRKETWEINTMPNKTGNGDNKLLYSKGKFIWK